MTLLDREAELAVVDELLEGAASGAGAAVMLEAEAGMGKTALLREAGRRAEARGFRVLSAAGSVREQQFPFGLARQLFERELHAAGPADRERLLAGAARLAGSVLGAGPPASIPDPGFGIRHGLYWLAAHMAEDRPLALLVDDAQWADLGSLRWLTHLLHRLDGIRLAVVLSWRLGERGDVEPLRRELLDEGARPVAPGPLGVEAIRVLAGRSAGDPADERFAAACRSATGGNPFLLKELLLYLSARGVAPVAGAADEVPRATPAQVSRRIEGRLEALGAAARTVAEAAAMLEAAAQIRHVAALAELELAAVETAADRLMAARLLEDARPLRFLHPLVRQAVYEAIPRGRRAIAHRRCAALLAGEQPVGGHLLACEPTGDEWVTGRLLDEAGAALAAGAPEAAQPLLERALIEPPEKLRGSVLLQLGRCGRLLGEPHAEDFLREAMTELPATERAAARIELAVALSFGNHAAEAVAILDDAADEATDPGTRAHMQALRAGVAITEDDLAAAAGPELERLVAGREGWSFADRCLLATAAAHRTIVGAGTCAEAVELASRALAGPGFRTDEARDTVVYGWAARGLMWADAGDKARPHVDWALADAARRGWRFGVMVGAAWRAWLSWWEGDLAEAEADAWRAVETGGPPYGLHFAVAILVLTLVDRGELEDAARVLAFHGVADGEIAGTSTGQLLRLARTRHALAARDPARALSDARAIAQQGIRRGGLALGLRPVMAHARALSGDSDAARRLVEQEIEAARRWGGAGHVAVAQRTAAELRMETDVPAAVGALRATPRKLELARALILHGLALRHARRPAEAREPLREALAVATACGATALAADARDELLAAGGRPRRAELSGVGSLTPAELRVARLAGDGLGNTEIAQALFVTRSTVEKHLGSVFRKLDVRRREELAARLS